MADITVVVMASFFLEHSYHSYYVFSKIRLFEIWQQKTRKIVCGN